MSGASWMGSPFNGEPAVSLTPINWGGGNPRYAGVIYCHGHGGDETENWHVGDTSESQHRIMDAILAMGFPVLSANFGGNLWGNSDAITRLDAAVNYMQNVMGANPDKVFLIGHSMGHLTAMNWARNNPTKVAGVIASMGVTDLNDIHSQYSDIDTAYPSGNYNTEAYNPMINAASKFGGKFPWLGFIGSTDTVAKTANMQQFGTLLKSEVSVVSGGHAWGTVDNYDKDKYTAFIRRHGLS